MPEGYKEWRDKQIVDWLDRGSTNSPTNHSTTMTNPDHAKKALAYDVAIGVCYLTPEQMKALRIEADWRMEDGIPGDNPNKKYTEYFVRGKLDELPMHEWVPASRRSRSRFRRGTSRRCWHGCGMHTGCRPKPAPIRRRNRLNPFTEKQIPPFSAYRKHNSASSPIPSQLWILFPFCPPYHFRHYAISKRRT